MVLLFFIRPIYRPSKCPQYHCFQTSQIIATWLKLNRLVTITYIFCRKHLMIYIINKWIQVMAIIILHIVICITFCKESTYFSWYGSSLPLEIFRFLTVSVRIASRVYNSRNVCVSTCLTSWDFPVDGLCKNIDGSWPRLLVTLLAIVEKSDKYIINIKKHQ